MYDGTKPFNLSEYHGLPVVGLDDRSRLQARDVVLVVFTLGHYANKEFKRGPGLSFNIQDAILLCRNRDHHAEEGEVVAENGELFPIIVPRDVSLGNPPYNLLIVLMNGQIRDEFNTALRDVGEPHELFDRIRALSGGGVVDDDVEQGDADVDYTYGDEEAEFGRTVIFL